MKAATSTIPTSDALALTSTMDVPSTAAAAEGVDPRVHEGKPAAQSTLKRDDWMTGGGGGASELFGSSGASAQEPDHQAGAATSSTAHGSASVPGTGAGAGSADFFTSLGTLSSSSALRREQQQAAAAAEAEKNKRTGGLKVSEREINLQFKAGKTLDEYDDPSSSSSSTTAGGAGVGANGGKAHGSAGWQWRMMKLRKTLEAAGLPSNTTSTTATDEASTTLREEATERYGSWEAFQEALAEKRFLDARGGRGSGSGEQRGAAGAPPASDRPGASGSGSGGGGGGGGGVTYMFNDMSGSAARGDASGLSSGAGTPTGSRPISRQSFRKPGQQGGSAPTTPSGLGPSGSAAAQQAAAPFSSSRPPTPGGSALPLPPSLSRAQSKSSTPIPSVFTPVLPSARKQQQQQQQSSSSLASDAIRQAVQQSNQREQSSSSAADAPSGSSGSGGAEPAPLSTSALNKLQARAMKADMLGRADEARKLREEYEREKVRADEAASKQRHAHGGDEGDGYFGLRQDGHIVDAENGAAESEVHVLPTLDGRGQLYDVGRGAPGDAEDERARRLPPGNGKRHRRKEEKFETRDAATGEMVRYNADDDEQTLADLVRQERFSAGSSSLKNSDAELASRIMSDSHYRSNLDYVDENVERLARKNMKSDAMKRQFAIQDFARTKKALDTCRFCWQDEGASAPRATAVASGTRVYLALPEREQLVEEHCLIVPIQHHLSTLELDDDCWDEIKVGPSWGSASHG